MAADTDVLRIQPHEMDALRPDPATFKPTESVVAFLSGALATCMQVTAPCPRGPNPAFRGWVGPHGRRGDWRPHGHGGGGGHGGNRGNRHPQLHVVVRRPATPASPARRLMAALNKLSARNYGKITHEIAGIIASSDRPAAADAVAAALAKSATDACYADVYVRMLVDVARELSTSDVEMHRELGAAATEQLDGHVDACLPEGGAGLAEAVLQLAAIPPGSAAEYDDLCASVKAKKQLSGRIATALAVVWLSHGGDARKNGAAESICRALATVVSEARQEDGDSTSRAIEALMDAVKMLLARQCSVHLRHWVVSEVRKALPAGSEVMAALGGKCRFLIDDVVGRVPTPVSAARHRGGGKSLAK